MCVVPHHEPVPEALTHEKRASDYTGARLFPRALGPEGSATGRATGGEEEGGMDLGVESKSTTMATVNDPAPGDDGPVTVVRLIALGEDVMVGLHPQGSWQRQRVETEPVDGTFAETT